MYRVCFTALATVILAMPSTDAQAFGDQCYRDVRAQGSVQNSMGRARSAAITAWEGAIQNRYGSRFADWYYSGDRTIDCTWDASGTRIRCTAVAQPCGRKR
jgi:hypothetical protein